MNIFCPTVNPCGDFSSPYANLSAEAPDSNPYIGISYGDPQSNPPLGTDWKTWSCLGFCDSTVSQTAADQCAANNQLICLSQPGHSGGDGFGPSGGGGPGTAPAPGSNVGPFGGTTGTTGNPITGSGVFPLPPGAAGNSVFSSAAISCMATCPDGTQQKFTLPAGYVVAASQVMADRQAASLCPALAQQNLVCFGPIKPFMCLFGDPKSIKPSVYMLSGGGATGDWTFDQFGGPPNFLPQGFTLNQIGPTSAQLAGSPNKAGNIAITIQATRKNPPLTLTVNDTLSVLGIDPDTTQNLGPDVTCDVGDYMITLAEAPFNQYYSETLSALGGVGPYTFKFTDLPQWLTGASDGTLNGTPKDTDAGLTFLFDVSITDSATPKAHTCSCCAKVRVPCAVACISPGLPAKCPPDGTICVAYTCQFRAVPNLPGTTFDTLKSRLPDGLKIDANTGVVTGKPCKVGQGAFDIFADLPNGGVCETQFQCNIADDGINVPSQIKDIVWVNTTVQGSGSSSMAGGQGVIKVSAPWDANCGATTGFERSEGKVRNCCGSGDYTATVTLNWTNSTDGCTPDGIQPLRYCLGIIHVFANSNLILAMPIGDGIHKPAPTGSNSVSFTVPDAATITDIILDVIMYFGGDLSVTVGITPPTPP